MIAGAIMAMVSSCSTGIESTKKIRMNKEDIRQMTKSEEQLFSSDIKSTLLKDWELGKQFLVTDDRAVYLFEPSSVNYSSADSIKCKIICYAGLESQPTPDLKEECVILFNYDGVVLKYHTDKTIEEATNQTDSGKLPFLADLDLIESWKEKLLNKTLWTKSNLWYDEKGDRKTGLKYAKVKVMDVVASSGEFPMNVEIDHEGDISYIHMNYTSEIADSRNFPAVFYLSDPKNRYPQISEENWKLIQNGKVALGMTKDECKLSLGNPDELKAGHSTTQTLDIWQYSNGTYLFFSDGLLSNFRQ